MVEEFGLHGVEEVVSLVPVINLCHDEILGEPFAFNARIASDEDDLSLSGRLVLFVIVGHFDGRGMDGWCQVHILEVYMEVGFGNEDVGGVGLGR